MLNLMWDSVTELVFPDILKEHNAFIYLGCLICECEGPMFLHYTGNHYPNDTASHHRRPEHTTVRTSILSQM